MACGGEGAGEVNLAARVGDRQLLKPCAGLLIAEGEEPIERLPTVADRIAPALL